ncbi:hypothetical protein [Brachyspira sp.]|uniref:hypothetical protein n=1 Tax=Brachyspira sp. TaxID=1977261 RepID=UPI003D7D967F
MQFTANQSSLNFFNFSKDKLLFIKSFLTSINFLSAFIRFAKISSLIKNSFGKNSLSLRGDSRSNLFCVDCHASRCVPNGNARNDKFKIYNDNKNNFAVLNNNVALAHCVMQGVRQRRPVGKTPCYIAFLTSIIFDSLSRKIKIPCLVINKNLFSRRIFMKNIKQFFTYMVVGALVMALSISCKSNEEPEQDNTHSNHPPSGTYSETFRSIKVTATVTTSGGTCNIKGTAYNQDDTTYTEQYDITITKWLHSDGNGDYVSAGSTYPKGEATINAPNGATDFLVWYNKNVAGSIELSFNLGGKVYRTAYNMVRQ